jgi:chemosensory pili system protein ChpC
MSAAELLPSEIRGVLIPVHGTQLLLPNAAVAEIIDYREPAPLPTQPDWVLGSIEWRQRNLLLTRFERLLGQPPGEGGPRQRIAVCHTLEGQAKRPFLGIVTTDIPRLVRITEAVMEGQNLPPALSDAPLEAALLFNGEPALIPDLAGLERACRAI